MSTKDQRTINMVHYPLGDSANPQELGDYLDTIDTTAAAKIGGSTGGTDNLLLRSDGTGGKTLQNSTIAVTDAGAVSGITTLATTGAITRDNGVAIPVPTQTVGASFVFKFPEDETVTLILKCPFAWTITETTTKTEVGTATCTFKIDGVSLGGTANSASTSEQSQAHSSANAVAADTDVQVTLSSTSSDCENLSITFKGTRTLS